MASRYFPHATYAEEQPYAKTILTTHVLHRGLQSGVIIGSAIGLIRATRASRKAKTEPQVPLVGITSSLSRSTVVRGVVLRSAGIGAITGTGLSALALVGRMWGREDVEWQDRSWRLLANRTQVETDDWSAAGSLAGGLGALAVRGSGLSVVRFLGGVGLGNVLAVGAMMGWRAVRGTVD